MGINHKAARARGHIWYREYKDGDGVPLARLAGKWGVTTSLVHRTIQKIRDPKPKTIYVGVREEVESEWALTEGDR